MDEQVAPVKTQTKKVIIQKAEAWTCNLRGIQRHCRIMHGCGEGSQSKEFLLGIVSTVSKYYHRYSKVEEDQLGNR